MLKSNGRLLISTANKDLYRCTIINVCVASSINSLQIDITLNGTFDLTGSEIDVANGTYTNQSGNITLASSISVTDAVTGATSTENSFLTTNPINLDFDGVIDFDENNLTITNSTDITVNYEDETNNSALTELQISSLGNNSYDTSKSINSNLVSSKTISPSSGLTGNWSYTPDADFNGTDSFIVTLTDDDGNTSAQEITIDINSINDAATFGGDATGTVSYTHLTLPTKA